MRESRTEGQGTVKANMGTRPSCAPMSADLSETPRQESPIILRTGQTGREIHGVVKMGRKVH